MGKASSLLCGTYGGRPGISLRQPSARSPSPGSPDITGFSGTPAPCRGTLSVLDPSSLCLSEAFTSFYLLHFRSLAFAPHASLSPVHKPTTLWMVYSTNRSTPNTSLICAALGF